MKKQKRREEKGITLVALVVTIIVLIILAGVTLNIVLDNDGIINKTKEATEEYENAQREEQELLGVVEDYIEYAGKTAPIPEGYKRSQITTEDEVAEGLVIYEIPEGATVNWTQEEDENGNNQSTITIDGTTTNLQETVNQYVWIPVEDINSMVMCSSNTADSVCNLVYHEETNELKCENPSHSATATELVGRLYKSTEISDDGVMYSYIIDFSKRDQTYNEDGLDYREPAIVTQNGSLNDAESSNLEIAGMEEGKRTADDFLIQLKEDFKIMATKVAKSKGFYISRYEIGENGTSKKGQMVLTASEKDDLEEKHLGANMWYGLYNICRKIEKNKQMIWGCQYDQVIKFIGEQSQIGHKNRNITTYRELSGKNELDKMKNIYDLEGNFIEWTQEANYSVYRVQRGSNNYYTLSNYFYPASKRSSDGNSKTASRNFSTRLSFYL